MNWDSVYIRFRNESGTPSLFFHHDSSKRVFGGTGDLKPVEVEVPVLVEADEDEPIPEASSSKGKRKAPEWT